MSLGVPPTAYDRAAIIFSPEGDLYQVKYAFEAVKRGWTSLGVRNDEAVILAAEKKMITKLMDIASIEKIYKVDDHIGVAFAGMGSDGRILIDQARLIAVRHRLLYGDYPTVEYVAKAISDIKQIYTQHGGVRPFGVSLIFGGVNPDGGVRLIKTDPGGQFFSYYAVAIGSGEQYVSEYLEKHYSKNLTFDELIELVLKALFVSRLETMGDRKSKEELYQEFPQLVEIGYVKAEDRRFAKMTLEEIKAYIEKIKDDLLGS